mgnify:CR=1 FL=1
MGEARRRKLAGTYPATMPKKKPEICYPQFVPEIFRLGPKMPNGAYSYIENQHGRFVYIGRVAELQAQGYLFVGLHVFMRDGTVYVPQKKDESERQGMEDFG